MSNLIKLDKGLKSSVVSLQIESVIQLSDLMKSNPLPMIVNSAYLKLADLFKSCENNFTRSFIVKAIQNVKTDNLGNVDEFLGRITSVLNSNDPVARSHTLRILGDCAILLVEKTDVLVRIQARLETNDQQEMEATIDAIEQIAGISRDFAVQVRSKLLEKIRNLNTSVHLKLRMIEILGHAHMDEDVVETFSSLIKLARTYSSLDFVTVIIKVISRLNQHSTVITPKVFAFFTSMIEFDRRAPVQDAILKEIAVIIKDCPELYSEHIGIDMMKQILVESAFHSHRYGVLRILNCFARSKYLLNHWFDKEMFSIVQDYLGHKNIQFRLISCDILLSVCDLLDISDYLIPVERILVISLVSKVQMVF